MRDASCGQVIKEKKGRLLLSTMIGGIVGLLIMAVFNSYYFAGSAFLDPMPLTHLISGLILGIAGGMVVGLAIRKK